MVKHLKVLGRQNKPTKQSSKLSDPAMIRDFVLDLIDLLGMQILGPIYIQRVPLDMKKLQKAERAEDFEDEGGVTGFALLTTSHIAFHTWPLRPEFHLDIYSCKAYDPEAALASINKYFTGFELKISDLTEASEWQEAKLRQSF